MSGHGGVGYGYAGSAASDEYSDEYSREHAPERFAESRPRLRLSVLGGRLSLMRHDHVHPGRSPYVRDPHPPTRAEIADMATSVDDVRVAATIALVERYGYDGPAVVDNRGLITDPAISRDIRARRYAEWHAAQDPAVLASRAACGLGDLVPPRGAES